MSTQETRPHFARLGCNKCHRETVHKLIGSIEFARRTLNSRGRWKCVVCRTIETRWIHKDGEDLIDLSTVDPREKRPFHACGDPDCACFNVNISSSPSRQAHRAQITRDALAIDHRLTNLASPTAYSVKCPECSSTQLVTGHGNENLAVFCSTGHSAQLMERIIE